MKVHLQFSLVTFYYSLVTIMPHVLQTNTGELGLKLEIEVKAVSK